MELSNYQDMFGSVLVFGSCSVIPFPTAEQLAEIAISAADTAKSIAGINPRVTFNFLYKRFNRNTNVLTE